MELMDVMKTSGTCRQYTSADVPADVLARVLDGARWAPTGGNRQGVRFVAVRDRAKRLQLAKWYRETWAPYAARSRASLERNGAPTGILDRAEHFAAHFEDVPVLVVVCAQWDAIHPTDHELGRISVVGGCSIYPAVQNLLLKAREEGLGAALTTLLCRYEPQVKALLDIPDGVITAAHIALGWPERPLPREAQPAATVRDRLSRHLRSTAPGRVSALRKLPDSSDTVLTADLQDGRMTTLTPLRQIELVAVARNQEATLDQSVRRLRDHLLRCGSDLFPGGWRITIADHASTDSTGAIADRLAAELDDVDVVHLAHQIDRKALRSNWARSQATIAAFVTLAPGADLDALLRPLVTHSSAAEPAARGGLTRRGALFAAGGIGLTALLAACGRNGTSSAATTGAASSSSGATSSSSTTAAAGATTSAVASNVVLAPEMTEGPYYLDLDLVRSDIREDREGAALALTLSVIDVSTGTPVSGAAVDIWHCDANGFYSGFVSQSAAANGGTDLTDDGTFLRGTQLSDTSGNVTFTTIYPGWYQGRTVHIHVKAHVNGSEIHTGQLFFDDAFTDEVFASAPYSSRGERELRNEQDNIFQGGGDKSTLTVTKDGDSYTTSLAMGVSA